MFLILGYIVLGLLALMVASVAIGYHALKRGSLLNAIEKESLKHRDSFDA